MLGFAYPGYIYNNRMMNVVRLTGYEYARIGPRRLSIKNSFGRFNKYAIPTFYKKYSIFLPLFFKREPIPIVISFHDEHPLLILLIINYFKNYLHAKFVTMHSLIDKL
ncbi:MAG: hypothetical protein HA488_02015 [Candidatus Verstraetearchaeota archaeon]|nr:hypothetical protein [Candidatus Verstraetearchaeota archaeon]